MQPRGDDLRPRRISRVEFDQMGELGMFDDEKVELLRGVVVHMSPEGLPHVSVSVWLNRRLVRALDDEYVVRPDKPFAAGDDSEPEPDFVITREDPRNGHPTTALLLIEISHSSLRKDRGIKREIYGECAVPEYWIVDVSEPGTISVEVYTEPTKQGYGRMVTLRDGDVLRPLHVPIEIAIADIPR
jgi:Uma2 family endonuclease